MKINSGKKITVPFMFLMRYGGAWNEDLAGDV
jgi:hypothetical protein